VCSSDLNAGTVTLDEKMYAVVEPESGDTRVHPDLAGATDPELATASRGPGRRGQLLLPAKVATCRRG